MIETNLTSKRSIVDKSQQINIDIYENFISESLSDGLMDYLVQHAKWRDPFITKSGKTYCKRNKSIYGSISKYNIVYRGMPITTNVHNWDHISYLKDISQCVEQLTKEQYNTVTLQYYPNENVGIQPHRDKEVSSKDLIVSLSVGDTRIMRFERNGIKYDIPLPKGSLCVINPPTNDKWLHSIVCESEHKAPRISIVFRNHESL